MRRLALLGWLASLFAVITWLRDLPTAGDPTFAAARMFALSAATYLLVATVVNVALALCRVRFRLPLVPLLVVASLGAPIAGTPAFAVTPPPSAAASAPPVMHRITDPPAPVSSSPVPPVPPRSPVVATPHMWTVRHGDNFWSIAAKVTRTRLDRPPTTAEIAAYWRPLIAVNRSRLVRPGDPGLLFTGQVLVLP